MKKICLIYISLFLDFYTGQPIMAQDSYKEAIVPIPVMNISRSDIVELGEILFHDVRLSRGAQVACASCHSMKMGGADGQQVSSGVNGKKGQINSPSVFNSRLNFRQFWDGRSENLLQQIDFPVSNPVEMNFSWKEIVEILKQDLFYQNKFNQAYADGMTIKNIKHAIVTFEESLLTPDSRFDLYLKGNQQAITNEEKTGYKLFKQYGCISCHNGVAIGANQFQKLGVMQDYFLDESNVSEADYGRFNVTKKEKDRYVFKVPSLRNVALTAPYLHDGSQQSLSDVIKIMMKYQLEAYYTDKDIGLIVKFLHTLTGKYRGELLTE